MKTEEKSQWYRYFLFFFYIFPTFPSISEGKSYQKIVLQQNIYFAEVINSPQSYEEIMARVYGIINGENKSPIWVTNSQKSV